MNNIIAPQHGKPSRRTILAGAAWSVPVIAATTASPQVAASGLGDVPSNRLRIADYRAENRDKDGFRRGPIHVYVPVHYDQNIDHNNDPATANVPWTVTINGPLGISSRTGTLVITKYGYAAAEFEYVDEDTNNLPDGNYTFTLVLYGSDGTLSATISMTISGS